MSAYIGSTPKAPLDPATAEFVKGKPPIVQQAKNNAYYIGRLQQHLDDFDKDLAEWKASGEWKKDYKTWGAACQLALNMSQQWANTLIRNHEKLNALQSVAPESTDSAEPDTDKANTLANVNTLPDPEETREARDRRMKADLEEEMRELARGNGHKPKVEPPKPVPEAKPRERTHNGKPIYAMPAWKELEDHIGKAINRTDAVNHLLPKPDLYKTCLNALQLAFKTLERWHELAKKA